MRSRRVLVVFVGAVVSLAACATGAVGTSGGGVGGTSGDGGAKTDGGYSWGGDEGGPGPAGDAGTPLHPPKDGGGTAIDSGTTLPPPDAGSTGGTDFCTGATSSLDGNSYDDWCDYDYYYQDTSGSDFECVSNDDCQTFGAPGCCYQPPKGSACRSDYGNVPQCVPQ